MAWYSALLKIFSGSTGNIIESISNVVDEYVTTDEEKAKLKMQLKKLSIQQQVNSFDFQRQFQEIARRREEEIEKSIRAELEAKAGIMMAELKQLDKYTKRARPTVVYAGLIIIFLEMFGLRYLILNSIGFENFNEILKSSKSIFETFLYAWAGVVGVYAAGRSAEKRGIKNKMTSVITGNNPAKEIGKIKW
jgi:hypothetical protein